MKKIQRASIHLKQTLLTSCKWMPKKSTICWILGISLLFIALNTILYAVITSNDVPQGDYWRWFRKIIRFDIGNLYLWDVLFCEKGIHTNFFALATVLMDYYLFDLSLLTHRLIGLITYGILGLVIAIQLWPKAVQAKLSGSVILLAIFSGLYSIASPFYWSLPLFEFVYILGIFLLLILTKNHIQSNRNPLILITGTTIIFWCCDIYGIIVILATIIALSLQSIWCKDYLKTILILGASLIVNTLVFSILRYIIKGSIITTFASMTPNKFQLFDIINLLKSVIFAFSQSIIVYKQLIILVGHNYHILQLLLAILVFCFLLAMVKMVIKTKNQPEMIIPISIVLFAVFSLMGVLMQRVVIFGPEAVLGYRYIRFWVLFSIAPLWAALISWNSLGTIIKRFAVLFSTIVIVAYIFTSYHQWKYIGSRFKATKRARIGLLSAPTSSDIDLGKYLRRCRDGFCDNSVKFLYKNRLSVFRDIPKEHEK